METHYPALRQCYIKLAQATRHGMHPTSCEQLQGLDGGMTGTWKPAQGGAIINTGSMAAVAANPEQCSYVATKHALLGFSMSAFEVLRHHGVKVAIINPGALADSTAAF